MGEGPPDLDSLPDLVMIRSGIRDKSIQIRLGLADLYIERETDFTLLVKHTCIPMSHSNDNSD